MSSHELSKEELEYPLDKLIEEHKRYREALVKLKNPFPLSFSDEHVNRIIDNALEGDGE